MVDPTKESSFDRDQEAGIPVEEPTGRKNPIEAIKITSTSQTESMFTSSLSCSSLGVIWGGNSGCQMSSKSPEAESRLF